MEKERKRSGDASRCAFVVCYGFCDAGKSIYKKQYNLISKKVINHHDEFLKKSCGDAKEDEKITVDKNI